MGNTVRSLLALRIGRVPVTSRWPAASLWLLLSVATPARAQVSLFSWNLSGNASGSGQVVGETLTVVGPDEGGVSCSDGNVTFWRATAPHDGTIVVQVDFVNGDHGGCHYDAPVGIAGGELFKAPTSSSCWGSGSYQIEFAVQAGAPFGLGVWAADCAEGPGFATFHDLQYLTGGFLDLGQALDPRVALEIDGPVQGASFGAALDSAGDVDGDGVADLLVGSPLEGPAGRARILSGTDGSLLHLLTAVTSDAAQFGAAVAGLGDVDGDGTPDVAVGAPFDDAPANNSGSVHVFSGADGALLFSSSGQVLSGFLGRALAATGDFDGDGFADLAVGQPSDKPLEAGRLFVLGGPDGHVLLDAQAGGIGMNGGRSIAVLDDLDGGGLPEIAVGAPFSNSIGFTPPTTATRVVILSGESGSQWKVFQGVGMYGWSLAAVPDQDNDGFRDLAVGAPTWTQGQLVGAVQVVSPQSGLQLGFRFAPVANSHYADALAGGPDLDGDGFEDLVVSAPFEHAPGATGVVHLYRLPALSTGPAIAVTEGGLGSSLALVTDGSGADAVLAGAPTAGSGGKAFVLAGLGAGAPPHLSGSGLLQSGTSVHFTLTELAPLQPSWLVVGASALGAPFKGGTLVPQPDLIVPLAAPASGQVDLVATWPAFAIPWTSLWLQAWSPSTPGPQGWAASNALKVTGNP